MGYTHESIVEVYWNLHKKCFSVRHRGVVIAHCTAIQLQGCAFVVQPKGRERVRREKKLNVHAFVRGQLAERSWGRLSGDVIRVSYDPYVDDTFINVESATRTPVRQLPHVLCEVGRKKVPGGVELVPSIKGRLT